MHMVKNSLVMVTTIVFVLALGACEPLGSIPDPEPRSIDGATIGAPGIDVQNYLLDITWDDETGAIDATATLNIEATQELQGGVNEL